MRHGKKFNHLGRTSSHRKALLSNMASSLILHKKITTTVAKAKELRKYVEPLITKAKDNTTHSRRVVFSYLQNKETVHELFGEVASKIGNRPGGYTRILKLGNRLGDNAEMALIELVDYNEFMLAAKGEKKDAKSKTRRSRRGSGSATATAAAAPAAPKAKAPKKVKEAKPEEAAAEVEETTAEATETPQAEISTETPSAEAGNEEAPESTDEEKKD